MGVTSFLKSLCSRAGSESEGSEEEEQGDEERQPQDKSKRAGKRTVKEAIRDGLKQGVEEMLEELCCNNAQPKEPHTRPAPDMENGAGHFHVGREQEQVSPGGGPSKTIKPTKPAVSVPVIVGAVDAAVSTTVVLGVALGVGLGVGLNQGSSSPGLTGPSPSPLSVQTYYLSAEQTSWIFAPSGENRCSPIFDADDLDDSILDGDSGNFTKATWREFTNDDFTKVKPRGRQQRHLGILGPLILALAGETFRVVLRNNLGFRVSFQPSVGVFVPASGSDLTTVGPAIAPAIQPGEILTMDWTIPSDAAPTFEGGIEQAQAEGKQTSRLYLYRSGVDPVAHDNAGLVGPMLVTASGMVFEDGTTEGLDRELITVYQVFDEAQSPFQGQNRGTTAIKHTVNGLSWCNLEGLEANAGQKVRWHVGAVGTDLCSSHWEGNTLLQDGHRTDTIGLADEATASADLSSDNNGTWLVYNAFIGQSNHGMAAQFSLSTQEASADDGVDAGDGVGNEKHLYIGAVARSWLYTGPNEMSGSCGRRDFDSANETLFRGYRDYANNYTKLSFVEFPNSTFDLASVNLEKWRFEGLLGPTIKAHVGDTLNITLANQIGEGLAEVPESLLDYPVSLVPSGLHLRSVDGVPYDGTTTSSLTFPGRIRKYVWEVPESAGPGPLDLDSKLWSYHSGYDLEGSMNAGLFGAIIVYPRTDAVPPPAPMPPPLSPDFPFWNQNQTRKLAQSDDGVPESSEDFADSIESSSPSSTKSWGYQKPRTDEIVLFFGVLDETKSPLSAYNKDLDSNSKTLNTTEEPLLYRELSLKRSINGYMFCSLPNLVFSLWQTVRMHILSFGFGDMDVHIPSISGGVMSSRIKGHTSSFGMLAGGKHTVDVTFTDNGTLPLSCGMPEHALRGMEGRVNVVGSKEGLVPEDAPRKRFFIAAEHVTWDYAPEGAPCQQPEQHDDPSLWIERSNVTIGSQYQKAVFQAYTSLEFAQKAPREHGLLGPLISAEVGDVVEITLQNNLDFSILFTMQAPFIQLSPSGNERFDYDDDHDQVFSKQSRFFSFYIPEEAGPDLESAQPSTTVYTYSALGGLFLDEDSPSKHKMVSFQDAGMVGLAAVTQQGGLGESGTKPDDVDMLVPLLFQVHNKSSSPLLNASINSAGLPGDGLGGLAWVDGLSTEDRRTFQSSNLMAAINGYSFCNFRAAVKAGQRVRLLLASFGSPSNIHGVSVQGQTLLDMGTPTQSQLLMPGIAKAVDVQLGQDPGLYPIICDVHAHLRAGMIGQLDVQTDLGK